MIRWIVSRLPYSWVKNIDFFMHKTFVPDRLWRPICDEWERRMGVSEELLEQDRKRRQAKKKWWER